MKLTRNYLKSDEIAYITNNMIIANDEFDRQIIKYGLIGKILIGLDELGVDDDCVLNEIYNIMVENAIDVDKEVVNIGLVDRIVDKELGTAKVVENVLNDVIAQINESMANINLKSMLVELNNLQKNNEQSN